MTKGVCMYLKRIEIQGFKSFVDKTVLELDANICAIVGPNGSGKSNIADAIRWCLGEQSAKNLRGGNMQDVIFAGTEEVKPTGFAQVSITISNENKIFPLDYSEVTVTRRIFRSGESEYLINGNICRLKDVHELFMDTGLGRDGYSIIGQGKIDEILSVKSEDRRQIFEEAAGISKYKYRRLEAQRKLSQAEENLIRVSDIINELELQLEPLSKQAEKAKEYLKLYEMLKKYEVSLGLNIIDKNREALEKLKEEYKILASDLERQKQKEKQVEDETNKLYVEIEKDNENIKKTSGEKNSAALLIETLKGDIAVISNDIKNKEEKIEEFKKEIEERLEKEKAQKEEFEKLNRELEYKNQVLKLCQKEIEKLNDELEACEVEIREKSTYLESLRDKISKSNILLSDVKSRIENFTYFEENFEEQKQKLATDLKNEEAKKSGLIEKIQKIKKQKQELESLLAKLKNEEQNKLKARDELAKQVEEEKNKYNANSAQMDGLSSKLAILKDMEREMEGYSKSVKAIIKSNINRGVRGVLSKLISVPGEYVTAIEVALGASAQNIVVETEYDAKEIIEYLKEHNLGRATFLPLSSIRGKTLPEFSKYQNEKGVIGLASSLVNFDKEYEDIINSLLGRIIVVDNIDNAISLAKKANNSVRIVTQTGESIQTGGAITGGSLVKSGIFTRAKEINEINEKISLIKKQINQSEKKIENGILKLRELNKELESIQKEIADSQGSLVKLDGEITVLENLINERGERIKLLSAEMEKVYSTYNDASAKREELKHELERINGEIKENESLLIRAQNEFKELMNKKDSINQAIFDKKMHRNSVFKDAENIEHNLGNTKTSIEESQIYVNYKREQIKTLTEEIEKLKRDIENKEKEIDTLNQKLADLANQEQEILNKRAKQDERVKVLREEAKSLTSTILALSGECQRMENKITRVEAEIENAINKLWEEYELTYSTAQEYKIEIKNTHAAEKEAASLKSKIKALGTVNIDAIEEYKNVYERYTFLTTQRDDIIKTKKDLEKIIDDLTDKMKTQFEKEFKIINENFNEVFRELFGGGRAELRLVDPKDVLNSGIEIDVQPPGKKLQNLMLLSGGERAFTAIALLFAILKTRPTPFCILDEIEAALDDVNVYRFAEYVKKFSQNTQFIIVTHRRGTMEAADILYGVTMQQKGISKLISMQLT